MEKKREAVDHGTGLLSGIGGATPRAGRRQGEELLRLLRNPIVAQAIAAGLVAVAARLTEHSGKAKRARGASRVRGFAALVATGIATRAIEEVVARILEGATQALASEPPAGPSRAEKARAKAITAPRTPPPPAAAPRKRRRDALKPSRPKPDGSRT